MSAETLTPARRATLDAVLDLIVPPSSDGRMPGASQVGVAEFLIAQAADALPEVAADLDELDRRALEAHGVSFAAMDGPRRQALTDSIRAAQPTFMARLALETVTCYYLDDRVLMGIGMEARPPWPKGYTVAAGDLSLLDPVRARGDIWRDPTPQAPHLGSSSRRGLLALAVTGVLLGRHGTPRAQPDWPNKPIRLVVGFAPGGPTDSFARLLAKKLTDQLGVPVSVENRVGANANIAAELVARAAPDGYTFLYNSSSLAISASLYRELRYDARRDLVPVGMVMAVPIVLVAHPSLPVATPAELVAYLKSRPKTLAFASGGVGNAQHLGMEMFLQAFGLDASHVPYKGSSQAHIDLLSGRTQLMMDTVGSVLPYIQDKRLRPIAVGSLQRISALPEVATLHDSGMPGFELEGWYGLLAPAKTPQSVVVRMNAEIDRAMKADELRAALAAQNARSLAGTPQSFAAHLDAEIGRYAKIVKALNLYE